MKTYGCRSAVFRGKAKKTTGGLKKEDLIKNKYGNIVSKKRSDAAKQKSNLGNFLFKKDAQRKLSISAPKSVTFASKPRRKLSIAPQKAVTIASKKNQQKTRLKILRNQ